MIHRYLKTALLMISSAVIGIILFVISVMFFEDNFSGTDLSKLNYDQKFAELDRNEKISSLESDMSKMLSECGKLYGPLESNGFVVTITDRSECFQNDVHIISGTQVLITKNGKNFSTIFDTAENQHILTNDITQNISISQITLNNWKPYSISYTAVNSENEDSISTTDFNWDGQPDMQLHEGNNKHSNIYIDGKWYQLERKMDKSGVITEGGWKEVRRDIIWHFVN